MRPATLTSKEIRDAFLAAHTAGRQDTPNAVVDEGDILWRDTLPSLSRAIAALQAADIDVEMALTGGYSLLANTMTSTEYPSGDIGPQADSGWMRIGHAQYLVGVYLPDTETGRKVTLVVSDYDPRMTKAGGNILSHVFDLSEESEGLKDFQHYVIRKVALQHAFQQADTSGTVYPAQARPAAPTLPPFEKNLKSLKL